MQFDEVNWTPVLVALAIGAIAGAILVIAALRRKSVPRLPDSGLDLRDLAGERDALIEQLQELEDTSTKTSADELARMRYELELKLAGALQQLEGKATAARAAASAKARPSENQEPEDTPAATDSMAGIRGFLWGIGGAAAIAGLVVFVLQTSEPKEQAGPQPGQQTAMAPDQELSQLEAAIQADPENLDLRVELARAYLLRNQMPEVAALTGYVLERAPEHPRALSYAALVKLQMGQHDQAIAMLRSALDKDPELMDGWIHLALVYAQMGRLDDAKAAIGSAKEKHPEQSAMLDGFLQQIEQQSRAQQPGTAQAATTDPGASVGGVVEVMKGAPNPAATASVFLIARDSSAPGGPPVAVKRLPATAFPITFTLDAKDSMMGQPLPSNMTIEARIDIDGNPMVSNNEPAARVENVALGATGVHLVLQ